MINTIFYFPESLTFDQYLDALNSNTDDGIASRTIVFAKQLGKIYNNGKIYGTTYSDVQNLIELNRYDDEEVRAAIEQLERDLQSESEAIDLQGLRYLALAGRVKTVEDHGYVNESEILTAVAGEIDGSTQKSSIRNKVNNVAKEASAALFTEVSDQNDNITALSIVNAITSNSTAKANLASSFNSGDNTMWANVVTQTDLNSATSALYAALQNKANDSEVVKKASIIASINSSGESNVSINADKIQLNGTAVANCLMAAQAVLGGFTIESSKLSNSSVEFNADGSGYLAAGSLSWDNAGNLTIGNEGSVTFAGTDLKILYNSAAISLNKNNSIKLYTDWMLSNPTNYYEIYGSENGSTKALYIRPSYELAANNAYLTDINLGGPDADINLKITGDVTVFGNGASILDGTDSVVMAFDENNSNKFTIITSAYENNQWTKPNVVFKEGVTANSFVKQGSSDNYVLLAGGGTKALSEFSSGGGSSSVDWSNVQNKPTNVSAFTNDAGYLTSHQSLAGYLPLTGGTLTGPLTTSGTTQGIQLRSRFENDAIAVQKYENNDWVNVCSLSGTGYVTGSTYHGNLYIVNNGTSDLFLKADGSVDSNTYLPVVNGTVSVSAGYMDIYSSGQPGDITTVFDAKSSLEVVFEGGSTYYFDNRVQAGSFVKLNATSDEVLMADGSTMTLAQLKAALDAI